MDIHLARIHALSASLDNPESRSSTIRNAYRDVFGTPNGQVVLADIVSAYHDRQSAAVNEEAAQVPHPYRAYYVEGQRSVPQALLALLDALEHDDDEETDDNGNT